MLEGPSVVLSTWGESGDKPSIYVKNPSAPRVESRTICKRDSQPINPYGAQILNMERDQRPSKPLAHIVHLRSRQPVLYLARETVSLPLELARKEIQRDTNERFQGGENHLCSDSAYK